MADAFVGKTDSPKKLAEIISELSDDLSNLSNEVYEMNSGAKQSAYIEVKEIGETITKDKDGHFQELSILQTANDHVFCVLTSFLTEQVGPLVSPYDNNIELVFMDGGTDIGDGRSTIYTTNDGKTIHYSNVLAHLPA